MRQWFSASDTGSIYDPAPLLRFESDPEWKSRPQGALGAPGVHAGTVAAQRIWVYEDDSGRFTFWRFLLRIPMAKVECRVMYNVSAVESVLLSSQLTQCGIRLIEDSILNSLFLASTKICDGRLILYVQLLLTNTSSDHVVQCNGFSAGVNPDDFKGPGFLSGYDPLWVDLLEKHSQTPFHVLVGGGDQLYCDV